MHLRTKRTHCLLYLPLIDTVRVLPTDITTMHLSPMVNVSLHNGRAGERLGVIPVNSIFGIYVTPSERKHNVNLEYLHCQCAPHMSTRAVRSNSMCGRLLS